MKKKNYLIIIAALLLFAGLFLYYLLRQPDSPPPSHPNVPREDSAKPDSSADYPLIKTPVATVSLANVYRHKITEFPTGSFTFKEDNDYHLVYYPKSQEFTITILNPDFNSVRPQAEAEFMKILETTAEAACSLKVYVNTITAVNPDLAGQNFKLSFCE